MRLAIACSTAAAVAALLWVSSAFAAPLKVACTGTSAMMGLGSSAGHHVPDELGKALGAGFDVSNFGVQGTTAIASIGSSYAATSQMKAALAVNPDVVLFWFGGNDSFQGTWDAHKSEFKADYTSLIHSFQALPTHPRTFLVRLWVFVDGPVQKSVLDKEILPLIDQIATDTGSTLIDYRKQFENHPEYFPDGMHPNDAGTAAIGKFFADSVATTLAAAGAGGTTSLGGAGGAGAGAGGVTQAAGGTTSTTGGMPDSGGAIAPGGTPNAPSAGTTGGGSAPSSGGNATSGTTQLPAAGTPNVEAPLGAANGDSSGCSIGNRGGASAPSELWLLFVVGLGLARRRPKEQC